MIVFYENLGSTFYNNTCKAAALDILLKHKLKTSFVKIRVKPIETKLMNWMKNLKKERN